MIHEFDQGYSQEPFRTLCSKFPGQDAYPQSRFRVEWGPIFHRGRLDGSAKVLVIGQDPAQHETILRRILVGEAGRRIQGFLAKLGVTRSYIMLNTFLYSVYGSTRVQTRRNPVLVEYRNSWLKEILASGNIEGVVALGMYADEAWKMWKDTEDGKNTNVPYAAITHPTQPESSSGGNKINLREATKKMLHNWNNGLQTLAPEVKHPDEIVELVLYGDSFGDNDKPEIPEIDLPPGLPLWTRENDGWARRVGTTPTQKRANITVTVPKDFMNIQSKRSARH
jgi:uracil-DNA glycosylase